MDVLSLKDVQLGFVICCLEIVNDRCRIYLFFSLRHFHRKRAKNVIF